MSFTLAPPYNALSTLDDSVRERGYALLQTQDFIDLVHTNALALELMEPYWHDLPADPYLRDGGHYRYRRHASMIVEGQQARLAPHRAHWQPEQYNALHGGIERWFEPVDDKLLANEQSIADTVKQYGLVKRAIDVKPQFDAEFNDVVTDALQSTGYAAIAAKSVAATAPQP